MSDDALSRCIYELGRQIPQAGGDERYPAMIETVPKRGYRLNGEITLTRPQAGTPGLRVWLDWRWLAAAIIAAAGVLLWFSLSRQEVGPAVRGPAGAGQSSIAVLPFVDMSAGKYACSAACTRGSRATIDVQQTRSRLRQGSECQRRPGAPR